MLLNIIKENFGDSVISCELMHPMVAANSDKHDTVKATNAKFGWGTKSGEDLIPLCDGLKLIKEISLNEIMKKYSVRGFMLRNLPLANKLNNRIAVLKLKGSNVH